jgi:hypothetical protein
MNKHIVIYGFSGKIGSGKDYIAKNIFLNMLRLKNIITKEEKPLFLAFADFLKTLCALKHNLSYDDVYGDKTSETRKLLQETGDELRKKYSENFFVDAMKLEIEKHKRKSDVRVIILTDVRFPEEVKMIKEYNGKIFRIVSPERTRQKLLDEVKNKDEKDEITKKHSTHRSETLLDNYDFDLVIYNDPKDNPAQQLFEWNGY